MRSEEKTAGRAGGKCEHRAREGTIVQVSDEAKGRLVKNSFYRETDVGTAFNRTAQSKVERVRENSITEREP